MSKRVILHYDSNFILTVYLEEGADVEVISVCDATPGDRAYRYSPEVLSTAETDAVLGPDAVGHKDDERMPALTARILEGIEGTPRLSLVTSEDDQS
jgi:hypothetical protein